MNGFHVNGYDCVNVYVHDANDYVRGCRIFSLRFLYCQNSILTPKSKVDDFHCTFFRDDDGCVDVIVIMSANGLRDDDENTRDALHSGHCAIYLG